MITYTIQKADRDIPSKFWLHFVGLPQMGPFESEDVADIEARRVIRVFGLDDSR